MAGKWQCSEAVMTTRVSLAELSAAEIRLHPAEAVAIVSEVCRRCDAGALRGMPRPGVIRLNRDGDLIVEGPTTTGDDVAMAAHLLSDLLSGADAAPEYRASGALRLVIARALGALDLPPFASLSEFCAALQRFSDEDVREAARALFHAWERAAATKPLQSAEQAALTISDIRRARRATGLSLQDVAVAAEVPATQLRDLEWGLMRSWRANAHGRAQVVRYARAAGLDESVVLSIAWPLIEEAAVPPAGAEVSVSLIPAPSQTIVVTPRRRSRRVTYAAWTLAAIAALVLAVLTGVTLARMTAPPTVPQSAAVEVGAANTADVPAGGPSSDAAEPPPAAERASRPAQRVPAVHPVTRRQSPARAKRQERKPNLLHRELIRFVFR
jgi:hypothetical protein